MRPLFAGIASTTRRWSKSRSPLDRACFFLTCVASIWFALAAAWGFDGFMDAGHYGSVGGMGIAAENMWRWHVLGPYAEGAGRVHAPSPVDFYCNHPFGVFWDLVPLLALLGHHDWVLRAPGILMSAATPPLLYGIGKTAWGPVGGAAAACGFVVVPIALGFANFHSLEVMTIFGSVLFFWGQARLLATGRPRFLWASLAGEVVACSGDWPGFLIVGALLVWGLFRGFLLPRSWTPPVSRERYMKWWGLAASAAVAMFALWMGLFGHWDKLKIWLEAGSFRSSGNQRPLRLVLENRRHWNELMFTPLAIGIGKLALPIASLRALFRRRDDEFYSLALLFGATIQYVVFSEGADVHIFWPHYFAPYFALAFAQVVVSIGATLTVALRRFEGLPVDMVSRAVSFSCMLVPVALLLPDSVRVLRYGRESGGRFNASGAPTSTGQDLALVIRALREKAPDDAVLRGHRSVDWQYYHEWTWDGPRVASAPVPTAHTQANTPPTYFFARAGGLSRDEQVRLAKDFHVRAFGDVWLVDLHEPAAPIDASSFAEREPNWLEWFVYGGWQPIRTIVADPLWTCELRLHFGQPCDRVDAEPVTLEQMRMAHNIAVANGNDERARHLRERIESALDRGRAAVFTDGIRLIGTRMIGGTQPRIETWFEASSAVPVDAWWTVHSKIIKAKSWSLIPPDLLERQESEPTFPSTASWRPHFLYTKTAVFWHRIGVESFYGYFSAKGAGAPPKRIDGAPRTELATLQ